MAPEAEKGLERKPRFRREKRNFSKAADDDVAYFRFERVHWDSTVMTSFKELRELFLMCHDESIIDDDEFVLLYDLYESKNPDFSYESYPDFDLQDVDEAKCLAEFRFRKRDIPLLADKLQIPPSFICKQRSICDGITGLCMLLRRLHFAS